MRDKIEHRVPREAKKANKRDRRPWTPPATLSPDLLAKHVIAERISLRLAIDLMAFGGASTPNNLLKKSNQRLRAVRAFCTAASNQKIVLYGSHEAGGDESDEIPHRYFDVPRCQDDNPNTLTTDLAILTMEEPGGRGHISTTEDSLTNTSLFHGSRKGRHAKWYNVKVQKAAFIQWLDSILPKNEASTNSEKRCLEWLTGEMKQSPDKKPNDKAFYRKQAINQFPGISKRRFDDRIWPNAIRRSGADSWAKAGRLKRIESPHEN